ncbi:CAF17-like 4Fe-4S cluster assembly/insertion protein YgfZ [Nocardioides sambongensis]|uniref:CAF17-like 4Fe-4S cluster assembly/insertion protein YgfZ n=1 Tax=Nocardioides sambongensis TaxID=2589074 RepID=UPI002F26DE32
MAGPDRLSWLHSLTTQFFEGLEPGRWVNALVLSPQGHIEHAFAGVDDGEAFTAHTEPGRAAALVEFLERMKFMTRVEITVADDVAVAWRPTGEREAGKYDLVPRDQLETYADAAGPAAGLWAFEALRIERGEPRFGLDTDERTIPNEVGWLQDETPWAAVHMDKGCYRGQETVARVHNLGRPPRRLTLIHLDGSENRLPSVGTAITVPDGPPRPVGAIGTTARHHELGPIGLALLKRNVSTDAALDIDGLPAAQEVLVDPEVGLHFRPRR